MGPPGAVFEDLLLRLAQAGRPPGDRPSLCGFRGVSHGGADFSCWTTHSQRARMHKTHSDNSGQPQIFILGGGGAGILQMPHVVYSGAG